MSTLFSHFFAKINQFSPLEYNFTEVLNSIALTPKTLYFYGKIPENMSKNGKQGRPKTVAIVGSRHNTKYGEEVAYQLAYELTQHGALIISGLAYGIDSVAHRGCLDAGGTTVAVLGTPINRIYPANHQKLAAEIIEKGGAVLSEYPPYARGNVGVGSDIGVSGNTVTTSRVEPDGSPNYTVASRAQSDTLPGSHTTDVPLAPGEYYDKKTGRRNFDPKTSFLYRNRLIAGLADAVVVVEAAERSGSLNTATHAIEQGKDVFAVPGNITSPYSQGCNKLIRQGAIPCTSAQDILELLFPEDFLNQRHQLKQQKLFGDNDVETAILQAISQGLRSGEDIMQHAKLPPEVFSQSVTLLEIKNRVRALGMNRWGLV